MWKRKYLVTYMYRTENGTNFSHATIDKCKNKEDAFNRITEYCKDNYGECVILNITRLDD